MMKDKRFVEEGEKRWLEFGFGQNHSNYQKFGKEYFRPVWYGECKENGKKYFQAICFDNAAERFCQYALKKPLKLKGKLIFSTDYSLGACDEDMHVGFKADNADASANIFDMIDVDFERDAQTYKMIKSQIPQWYLDGLAGEVRFEVELEVATRAYTQDSPNDAYSSFGMFYTACYQDDEVTLMTKNLKILCKIDEKMFDRDKYGDEGSNEFIQNFKAKLDTTDVFLSIYAKAQMARF